MMMIKNTQRGDNHIDNRTTYQHVKPIIAKLWRAR